MFIRSRPFFLRVENLHTNLFVFIFRLFTAYPEVITLFSFSSEVKGESMDESSGLKNQAFLLMSMIDYAVSQLGNLSELVPKLKALGQKHFVQYQVKPEHFKVNIEIILFWVDVSVQKRFFLRAKHYYFTWQSITFPYYFLLSLLARVYCGH